MSHKDMLRLLSGISLEGVFDTDIAIEGKFLDELQARAAQLQEELFPDLSSVGLPDWERVVGLPDPCIGHPEAMTARRAMLLGRVAAKGRMDRAHFIAVAAALGYPVTITEFPVAMAGAFEAGDGLGGDETVWTWRINAPETTVREFTCLSACTEPLRAWGNELLECVIRRIAPAHTTVIFAYGEGE